MSIKHSDISIQFGYATVSLGQIHYAQAGAPDAPPLTLMHAAGRSSSCYRHMLPLLAKDFRAIAIDLPGFGYSARMADHPTIDGLAQTLTEFMDALSLQRPHIVGLHTGNKIAASLAANWPERVGDVILAGQTHSLILDMKTRNAALAPYCEKYFPKFSQSSDGSHLLKAWNITQAAVEGFWWPPELVNAQATQAADLAQAEVRVLDHLHGWESIVPLYRAIFAFDLLIHNVDRHLNNYLYLQLAGDTVVKAMDHSRCLWFSGWPMPSPPPVQSSTTMQGALHWKSLVQWEKARADKVVDEWCTITKDEVAAIFDAAPAIWTNQQQRNDFLQWWGSAEWRARTNEVVGAFQ